MPEQVKPSAGALKAWDAALEEYNNHGTRESISLEIDRETGVAELLEAAKDYVYAAFPDNHYVQNRQRLTTAIAKAERGV